MNSSLLTLTRPTPRAHLPFPTQCFHTVAYILHQLVLLYNKSSENLAAQNNSYLIACYLISQNFGLGSAGIAQLSSIWDQWAHSFV